MARLRRLGRRPLKHYQSTAKQLDVLAIAQLATAEDDDDELLGLVLAGLAADYRRKSRSKKYGMRGEYNQPKSKDFFDILLGQASERQFKAWFRMRRESFWHLHNLICGDPIFVSTSNRPQRPVYYQLATFLCRLGAESGLKTAGVMSIAEGSVYIYCYRVCQAIRNIRSAHLAWPGEQRRQFLSAENCRRTSRQAT